MRITGIFLTVSALALASATGRAAAQADAPSAPQIAAQTLATLAATGTMSPESTGTMSPEAAAAMSPEAAAFRTALMRETADLGAEDRDAILGFYAARDFTPYWTAGDGAPGAALAVALAEAPTHGLPLRRYNPGALTLLLDGDEPPALVEVAATRTYLSFARDLNSGLLTPVEVDDEINIQPARPERSDLLDRLRTQPVAEAIAQLEPASAEYRSLISEKARLETQAVTADWGPEVPSGATMRLGDGGPRVAALRARLAARGFAAPADVPAPTPVAVTAAPAPAPDPARFDAGLRSALQRFQAESGLEADGLAGSQTLAAVNERPDARLGQVIVNLERLRWMNRDLGPRHIVANIPDFSVTLVEDGAVRFRSRTVVGKATETRTPEFSENMTYMVVNPTWHIPDSIAQRIYLPQLKQNAQVLTNNNMRLFTRSGTEINPGLVDFTQFNQGNFPFRVKQNPSQANALGRVKFMFPNQFSIYLHDTPTRDLFARHVRAFSNGCIRVEDPLDLAYLLLEGQADDPEAAFASWLGAKTERTINLARPIPVHLVYRTVFVDDAGAIQRRFDVYGRDARVFEALEAAGVTLAGAQG